MSKFIVKEVLSYNNTLFSLCTTYAWTEYKHSNDLELVQLLLLDGYMLVSMVMLNNGCCCDMGLYTPEVYIMVVRPWPACSWPERQPQPFSTIMQFPCGFNHFLPKRTLIGSAGVEFKNKLSIRTLHLKTVVTVIRRLFVTIMNSHRAIPNIITAKTKQLHVLGGYYGCTVFGHVGDNILHTMWRKQHNIMHPT